MKPTTYPAFLLIVTAYAFLFFTGCAPVISKEIRDQVPTGLTFRKVAKDPEAHKGATVVWSGVIISAVNLQEGTKIEVLQKPSDSRGKPKDVDYSEGRFLVIDPRYLDAAIYTQGRMVTVAGEVQGKKIQDLGEMKYTYPLVSAKEIYLWPEEREEPYYYPYPYWNYPWWHYPYPHPGWW